jgi:hypothetical protein
VYLPSGLVVTLEAKPALLPRARAPGAPLFSELVEIAVGGDVVVRGPGGEAVDVRQLELRDFHTLRAIATRLGWLAEEPVEIRCRNCGESIDHMPCASFALGPYEDGELDDDELDRTLDLSTAHPIPPVRLRGGAVAREVELRNVTVAVAAPLHRALRRRRLVVGERVAAGMGVASLGSERDARRIADALARASDEAWAAIGDLFLAAHYPPRLGSIALCPACGARNDVDAPYERELEPSRPPEQSNTELFPDFDAFDARAREAFERIAGSSADQVRLVVEGGVAACDDGGEPLLGAYVPPGGDPSAPVGSGEITLFYRTFRAVWDEEGPYDWAAEVDETLEHELEHHDGWRVGHDPMDDEERAEIRREQERLVGRRAVARAAASSFGADVRGFLARTWLIWLIVAVVTVAISVCGR